MSRIIGVDPGSRVTGYGIIDCNRQRLDHVANGCVMAKTGTFPERIKLIFQQLTQLVAEYHPELMVLEQVFFARNPQSALKLGHARAAAMLAGANAELPIHEYSPRHVKQALTGRGGAQKAQIQHMVRVLLGLAETPAADAADALALAICHANSAATQGRIAAAAAKR